MPTRTQSSPPEAWLPLLRLARLAARPLESFLRIEASSGILLLLATAAALGWANSPWSQSYQDFWQTPFGVHFGSFTFQRSLAWWVNDVLMVIFFFVVGMEIRRELHHGELSDWRRASLPAAAALGGMMVPAALYLAIARDPGSRAGWGVPVATDIAFALGILALLGKRVPAALRVLLLALAVIDDLGAILVIAIFYSDELTLSGVLLAIAGLLVIASFQRAGVRSKAAYLAPAAVVWAGIYTAGVHPTIAGVIVGLLTPVRAWLGTHGFLAEIRPELDRLGQAAPAELPAHEVARSLRVVDSVRREAISPAESLIEQLHPWVAYGIMPVFALANAGVSVAGGMPGADAAVTAAIAFGLVIGKPVGVLSAIWLTLRLRVGALPLGITLRHLLVLGLVAGVGFTMSLFIAQLAFSSEGLLNAAKVGVLVGSGLAALMGLICGLVLLPRTVPLQAAQTADEAEDSTEQ